MAAQVTVNLHAIRRAFGPWKDYQRTKCVARASRWGVRARYRKVWEDALAGRVVLVNRVPRRPADRAVAGLPYLTRAEWRVKMAKQKEDTANRARVARELAAKQKAKAKARRVARILAGLPVRPAASPSTIRKIRKQFARDLQANRKAPPPPRATL